MIQFFIPKIINCLYHTNKWHPSAESNPPQSPKFHKLHMSSTKKGLSACNFDSSNSANPSSCPTQPFLKPTPLAGTYLQQTFPKLPSFAHPPSGCFYRPRRINPTFSQKLTKESWAAKRSLS